MHHLHDANCLAAGRAGRTGAQRCVDYPNTVILNLVQVALDQPTAPSFKVPEEKLPTLAFDFDNPVFGHVRYTFLPIRCMAWLDEAATRQASSQRHKLNYCNLRIYE